MVQHRTLLNSVLPPIKPFFLVLLLVFSVAIASASLIRANTAISFQHSDNATTITTTAAVSPSPALLANWFNPDSLIGGAPHTRAAPTATEKGFSDQSKYVGLGTSSGAVVAVADFNRDRFIDLLMLDSTKLRTLSVMLWDHDAYAFSHVAHENIIDLDGPAVRTAEAAAGAGIKPLGHISGVYVADFGNDGTVDVLITDGKQGRVFFSDGSGGFGPRDDTNSSGHFAPVVIPELSAVSAIVDADADSIPDVLTIFLNGTRGFWQLQYSTSDLPSITNTSMSGNDDEQSSNSIPTQRRNPVFRRWPDGLNLGGDGKPCRTEDDMAPSIAFADMDGDCLADLIIPTTCGLEVWSNPGHDNTFWDLSAAHAAGHMRLLDTQVFNYGHGDRVIVIADFDSDGTNDLAIVNRNRHDMLIHRNIQAVRPVGELCNRDSKWKLEKVVGMTSGVNLRKPRVGPLLAGAVDVPPLLHVGDYDQDGLTDIVMIDGSSTQPLLLRNRGTWASARSEEARFEAMKDVKSGGLGTLAGGNVISATLFDTDESGRQDLLVVRAGNETRLLWNALNDRWDALFFKGTMLSGLPYRAQPRPFAPVVGNTIKLSYMQRGSRRIRVRRVCSQCPQSAGLFQLGTCNCQYGLYGIANYVEELWAGSAGATRGWTGLMPNSMAVIWGDESANTAAWWMEYFTQRRGSQMLRVTAILMAGLVVLAASIVYLQHREAKEDRERDERESARLFNFVV